ncbi:DsbA family oxidoreductase [Nostocoides australiense]|nr:DsbA family oxidoreductase [Tetrasphaera australiensis]
MRIDVWSDIVCPFCHVGRRHLDLALAYFEHRDDVDVIWHSYELDRNAPAVGTGSNVDRIAQKYGVTREQMVAQHEQMAAGAAEVGLDFQWDRVVPSNSYDAHRLIHAAREAGVEGPVTERIMRGWYTEGAAIGDADTLRRLAAEGGLDAETIERVLSSDDHGIDVRTDEAVAGQIGITAVPTFVLDQKYAVTGAQPPQVLLEAIRHAWADRANRPEPVAAGGCGGGCCGGADGDGCGDEAAGAAGAACGTGGCGTCAGA